MPDEKLTIGELAAATGVATSALRYWEELGLLAAPARVSGQRRYPPSAVERVGLILVLRDVGYTLSEVKAFIAAAPGNRNRDQEQGDSAQDTDAWRRLAQRKIAELDERIAQAQAARTAIAHSLACPHEDGLFECPNYASIVKARLAGTPVSEAHSH